MSSAERADRLLELAGERELDGVLVTNLVNVRYLTGYTGSNGVCLVSRDERVFFTDFRYVSQAEEQVPHFERARGKQDLLEDVAARMKGRVGFDDADLSVRRHERLLELAPEGVELAAAGGLVERLRLVKDAEELQAVRAAAELADASLQEAVVERGLAGRSEREVAVTLERAMIDRGAKEPSFPPIVAAGAHGALPHAEPRDVEIPSGALVIVDWGARLDGYCSDCTRTFAAGEPSEQAREVYELVKATQETAREAVRAGADCREVDGVARKLIEEAGHGDRFGHGLGHGVGLEIHEEPRLSPLGDGSLATGNVVTVEPGVYLPGELGVRIEDLVAVTDGGCEVLSGLSRELTVV